MLVLFLWAFGGIFIANGCFFGADCTIQILIGLLMIFDITPINISWLVVCNFLFHQFWLFINHNGMDWVFLARLIIDSRRRQSRI